MASVRSAPPGSATARARRRSRACSRPAGLRGSAASRGTAARCARRAGPRPFCGRAATHPPWRRGTAG
eukprot:scaffold75849_cov66-Phaeocystis_antarctica.AAC.4